MDSRLKDLAEKLDAGNDVLEKQAWSGSARPPCPPHRSP